MEVMKKLLIVLFSVAFVSLGVYESKAQATVINQEVNISGYIPCPGDYVEGTFHFHLVYNKNFVKESIIGSATGMYSGCTYNIKSKDSYSINWDKPGAENFLYSSQFDVVKKGEGKIATGRVFYHFVETPSGKQIMVSHYEFECK